MRAAMGGRWRSMAGDTVVAEVRNGKILSQVRTGCRTQGHKQEEIDDGDTDPYVREIEASSFGSDR